jgi:hypothetical protein
MISHRSSPFYPFFSSGQIFSWSFSNIDAILLFDSFERALFLSSYFPRYLNDLEFDSEENVSKEFQTFLNTSNWRWVKNPVLSFCQDLQEQDLDLKGLDLKGLHFSTRLNPSSRKNFNPSLRSRRF